jgi:hypothetical protein
MSSGDTRAVIPEVGQKTEINRPSKNRWIVEKNEWKLIVNVNPSELSGVVKESKEWGETE